MTKVYKPLRSVRVTYSNDEQIETSVNGELSDSEIHDYFKVGKEFNIGTINDHLVPVAKCEILKYYIGARNAWDTVPIGYFDTEDEAQKCCDEGTFEFKEGKYIPYNYSLIKSKYV